MNNWKEELLALLRQQGEPISSNALAELLHVSSRTVKQHIKLLNEEQNDLIKATPKGYLLHKEKEKDTLLESASNPSEDRFSYFTQLFFIDHVSSISIYDLCEELFLSYSSIKLLISKLNQQYANFQLVLKCKNDQVSLHGTERDKRRFLTNAIYQEASGHLVDPAMLRKHFPQLDITYLQHTLHQTFNQQNCYIHDFGYTNLALHMSVILDRMINGNAMLEEFMEQEVDIHPITTLLLQEFAQHYQVCFNTMEQQNMDELILANINFCQGKDDSSLKRMVGEPIFQMTHEIIDRINTRYDLRLNKETLLYPLSLHFKNLFHRSMQQTSLKNPLLHTIQATCPLLYDCAIFISDYLDEHYNVQINADETAYLAMHIGADIERQQKDIKKLRCALLCPDYQQNQQQIYNYLLIHFDSDITIPILCSFEEELSNQETDIIFTTISMKQQSPTTLLIPPIKSAIDLKAVYAHIQMVQDKKKLQVLYEYFPTFFSKDLFLCDQQQNTTKEDILSELCRKLSQLHYVPSHFYYDVCKREEAASTAFGQIAIPHSMKMDAMKTGIGLAISQHGIQWNDQKVHLVLLMAINEQDTYLFKELYEAIILLCSQPQTLSLLKLCKSFEEFTSLIYHLK